MGSPEVWLYGLLEPSIPFEGGAGGNSLLEGSRLVDEGAILADEFEPFLGPSWTSASIVRSTLPDWRRSMLVLRSVSAKPMSRNVTSFFCNSASVISKRASAILDVEL